MMHPVWYGVALGLLGAASPGVIRADVTIRYLTKMSSPSTLSANSSGSKVIYMKGSQGVMVEDGQTMIVDFSRQRLSIPRAKGS